MQTFKQRPILFWSLAGLAVLAAIGGVLAWLTRPCPGEHEKRVWGTCYRDLQAKPLTIGIVNVFPGQNYQPLAAHLQKQLGVPVNVDGTPFNEISQRIARQDWDIAFTISPVFSVAAENGGYTGVAVMFPSLPYYRTTLFVRADSPIQSIADIKPTTTIALGGPESVPYFQYPIYVLYGRSLRVGKGYKPGEAIAAVKAGKVDVAAGLYDVVADNPVLKAIAVKNDPSLRIIYVSKATPNAGVYLSPKLAPGHRSRIKKALLDAPETVQGLANYGDHPIPKYDEVRKITARTTEVLRCSGLNSNSFNQQKPVNLFCKPTENATEATEYIEGQVREYKLPTRGNVELRVVAQNNQVFSVLVPQKILKQNQIDPVNAVDKFVQINDVRPKKLAVGTWQVKITQPNQLSLRQ